MLSQEGRTNGACGESNGGIRAMWVIGERCTNNEGSVGIRALSHDGLHVQLSHALLQHQPPCKAADVDHITAPGEFTDLQNTSIGNQVLFQYRTAE